MTLATRSGATAITGRDWETLESLDCHPLTAAQLLRLSVTFRRPFSQLRLVQRRLHRLSKAGLVRSWPYATTGGSPHYFKLTRQGYRMLHAADADYPGRRHFEPISPNRHFHTRALGDFLVRLMVTAHQRRIGIRHFARENALRIESDDVLLYPDCAFQLVAPGGKTFNFLVELDNGTERIRSDKAAESLARKLRGYDRHQSQYDAFDPRRYVVLFVTTRSSERVAHILEAAREVMANTERTVFLGIELAQFLEHADPITQPCFVDNRGKRRRMVSIGTRVTKRSPTAVTTTAAVC
jgi:hypothetical protein